MFYTFNHIEKKKIFWGKNSSVSHLIPLSNLIDLNPREFKTPILNQSSENLLNDGS